MKLSALVLGDPLSSGGSVTKVALNTIKANGLPLARKGDSVFCPIPSHGEGTIIEGFENVKINGLNPAVHGGKVSCGCTLVAKHVAGKVMFSKTTPLKINQNNLDETIDDNNWISFKINDYGSCEGLLFIAHFNDNSKKELVLNSSNKVIFKNISSNKCIKTELILPKSINIKTSVTELFLKKLEGK